MFYLKQEWMLSPEQKRPGLFKIIDQVFEFDVPMFFIDDFNSEVSLKRNSYAFLFECDILIVDVQRYFEANSRILFLWQTSS